MDEAATDVDRRSLIRRGLIAGGVATTVPIISTFGVAASAAIASNSDNGFQFVRDAGSSALGAGSLTAEAAVDSSTNCNPPAAWTNANKTTAADYAGTALVTNVTSSGTTRTVTMTVTAPAGCSWPGVATLASQSSVSGREVNPGGNNPVVLCAFPSVTISGATATFIASFVLRNSNHRLTRVRLRFVVPCS